LDRSPTAEERAVETVEEADADKLVAAVEEFAETRAPLFQS